MADEASKEHVLLQPLKNRLHIFTSARDSELTQMIESSMVVIEDQTGFTDEDDKQFIELVLERCRYIVNDSLEYFNDNFLTSLSNLSLKGYKPSEESDSDGETE